MWSSYKRKLKNVEKEYILAMSKEWNEEYLRKIDVRLFNVDSAHTIRNDNFLGKKLHILESKIINDDDGAAVEIVLYVSEGGDFGELEINRLDTKPLLLKQRI